MFIKNKFLKFGVEYEVSDKLWNSYRQGEIELPSLFERIYRKIFNADCFVACRMKKLHDLYLDIDDKTIKEVVEVFNKIDFDKSLEEEYAKCKQ